MCGNFDPLSSFDFFVMNVGSLNQRTKRLVITKDNYMICYILEIPALIIPLLGGLSLDGESSQSTKTGL